MRCRVTQRSGPGTRVKGWSASVRRTAGEQWETARSSWASGLGPVIGVKSGVCRKGGFWIPGREEAPTCNSHPDIPGPLGPSFPEASPLWPKIHAHKTPQPHPPHLYFVASGWIFLGSKARHIGELWRVSFHFWNASSLFRVFAVVDQ